MPTKMELSIHGKDKEADGDLAVATTVERLDCRGQDRQGDQGCGEERRQTFCVPQMDDVMTGVECPVRADVTDVGASGMQGELGRTEGGGGYLAPVGLKTLHIGQGRLGRSEGWHIADAQRPGEMRDDDDILFLYKIRGRDAIKGKLWMRWSCSTTPLTIPTAPRRRARPR